jgi:hypothetical protein
MTSRSCDARLRRSLVAFFAAGLRRVLTFATCDEQRQSFFFKNTAEEIASGLTGTLNIVIREHFFSFFFRERTVIGAFGQAEAAEAEETAKKRARWASVESEAGSGQITIEYALCFFLGFVNFI